VIIDLARPRTGLRASDEGGPLRPSAGCQVVMASWQSGSSPVAEVARQPSGRPARSPAVTPMSSRPGCRRPGEPGTNLARGPAAAYPFADVSGCR